MSRENEPLAYIHEYRFPNEDEWYERVTRTDPREKFDEAKSISIRNVRPLVEAPDE